MTHTEKDDLVERLRSAMCPGSERCNVLTCYPDCECGAMEAAAARIEALEEALKEVTECFSEDYSIAHPRSQAALKLASKMTKPRI